MKTRIELIYEWYRTDENTEVWNEHNLQLDQEAEERILQMQKDGYTSGELFAEIDGVEYSGHWSRDTKRLKENLENIDEDESNIKRKYRRFIESAEELGIEIKIPANTHICKNKEGYETKYFVPTISAVIGIGKNETAELIIKEQGWKDLLNGAEVSITTKEQFEKKYL